MDDTGIRHAMLSAEILPTHPACPGPVVLLLQSVATFTAMGPATNGKSVYQNCVDSVKKGWFSGSQVEKDLKKASDSWWPGDCESQQAQKHTACS